MIWKIKWSSVPERIWYGSSYLMSVVDSYGAVEFECAMLCVCSMHKCVFAALRRVVVGQLNGRFQKAGFFSSRKWYHTHRRFHMLQSFSGWSEHFAKRFPSQYIIIIYFLFLLFKIPIYIIQLSWLQLCVKRCVQRSKYCVCVIGVMSDVSICLHAGNKF